MFSFVKLFLLLHLANYAAGKSENVQCNTVKSTLSSSVQFNCVGLTTLLQHLQDAPKNTTAINIVGAKINVIPRQSFTKFGATLDALDLQRCGIETIEPDGFSDLYFMRKLVLSENKLTRIMGESFRNLYKLQYLDISFNNIFYIDAAFYQPQRFPILETLYFDYNRLESIDYTLFPLLYTLRKVKFGRNPWIWGIHSKCDQRIQSYIEAQFVCFSWTCAEVGEPMYFSRFKWVPQLLRRSTRNLTAAFLYKYRLLLTRQLENMRVDYRDDWEEWGWMSTAVRECEDNGKGNVPDNKVLDCVTLKLLRTEFENDRAISHLAPGNVTSGNLCLSEATVLIDCYFRSTSAGEAIRRTFEGITATLKEMGPSSGKVKSFPLVGMH